MSPPAGQAPPEPATPPADSTAGGADVRPIGEMSLPEQRRLLSRRALPVQQDEFVDIGGPNTHFRRAARMLGWTIVMGVVAGAFVLAFYRFTDSLRVALIVVAGMMLYMYAASRLAEGKIDQRD